MMRYQPREGVVGTPICGTFVLIPSRKVYDCCKTIQKMPAQWSLLWIMLEQGESMEHIYRFYSQNGRIPEQQVREKVDYVLKNLCQKGFLEEVPESETMLNDKTSM